MPDGSRPVPVVISDAASVINSGNFGIYITGSGFAGGVIIALSFVREARDLLQLKYLDLHVGGSAAIVPDGGTIVTRVRSIRETAFTPSGKPFALPGMSKMLPTSNTLPAFVVSHTIKSSRSGTA